MAVKDIAALKAKFEAGDTPTAQDFIDLIDSMLHADFYNWPAVLPSSSGVNLTDLNLAIDIAEYEALAATPGFVDSDTLTFTGDYTATLLAGRRLELILNSGPAYTEVLSSSHNAGVTTLELKDAIADNTISDVNVSIFRPLANGGALGMGALGISSYAQTLLDDANASAARATLGMSNYVDLKHNYAANAAPTVNDDSGAGYAVGSRWIDVTNDEAYVCVDAAVGAAIWEQVDIEALQFFQRTPTPTAIVSDTIDASAPVDEYTWSVNGGVTFNINNLPAGKVWSATILLTYTSGTITWTGVNEWVDGATPTLTGGKKYLILLHADAAGTVRASRLEFDG